MKRLEEFNPYDLNDIADIDKYIELWKQKKINDAINSMRKRQRPEGRRVVFGHVEPVSPPNPEVKPQS